MLEFNHARTLFIAVTGTVGGVIAQAFGGWDNDIITLIVFMVIDYIMGLAIALMCRSEKSEKGGISSAANWKGLCKKCITLMFIIVAHRLDILMDTEYIRSAVVIGFCASELVSITENAGIIGLPLPAVIINVIDVLKGKGGKNEQNSKGSCRVRKGTAWAALLVRYIRKHGGRTSLQVQEKAVSQVL